jgi:hypothetical protein
MLKVFKEPVTWSPTGKVCEAAEAILRGAICNCEEIVGKEVLLWDFLVPMWVK